MNIFTRVTLRNLGKNRIRTLVTIVGILLSAAMFTAVTTSIASLQDYLIRCAQYVSGDYHGRFDEMPADEMAELSGDSLVEKSFFAQNLGYAEKDSNSFATNYYYILGCDADFFANMPVHLTEGRLPENGGEIVLRDGDTDADGNPYHLGDTLTLELGDRMWEGERLWQSNPYMEGDGTAAGETLWVRESRTFTVVGFMERPAFEDYSAPGTVAVTAWDDGADADTVMGCFRLTDSADTYDFLWGQPIDGVQHYFPENSSGTFNRDLLLYEGVSYYNSFYSFLYGMAGVLIALIVFGSVSLIYNAFSISVSERTRQFGLLSSIGATRPQIRRMVMTEAMLLGAAGIVLGVGAGLLGIGVTFHFIGGKFHSLIGVEGIDLRLVISPAALVIAAVVAFLTVMISAWVPARRAMRVAPMEAIRQSGDVTIRARQVKTGRLTYRIFGLEGMLAKKHFRRNRRRYRATVVSLFMSVVLFISASAFCSYLTDAVQGTFESYDYDIQYDIYGGSDDPQEAEAEIRRAYDALSRAGTVTRTSRIRTSNGTDGIQLPPELLSREALDILYGIETAEGVEASGADLWVTNVTIYGVDEDTYRAYLRKQGLSETEFLDTETPKAVVLALEQHFNRATERTERMPILRSDVTELTVPLLNEERYADYMAAHETVDDWQDMWDTCSDDVTIPVGAVVEELPFGLNRSEYYGINIVLPEDYVRDRLATPTSCTLFFATTGHEAAMEELEAIARDEDLNADALYDRYASSENDRNFVLIIKVFAYGFITLISLIAVANVFNTVSTNLLLRRREMAMLRSVGMTGKGFRRMLSYECLLYGAKALLYGLPVAVLVTWWIYRSTGTVYETSFTLPWGAVAVAVGAVFAVVIASMVYAWSKLRKDNTIDALRSENI